MALSGIVEEMLDYCVSPDLVETRGLGGDNMTAVLVVFEKGARIGPGAGGPNSGMEEVPRRARLSSPCASGCRRKFPGGHVFSRVIGPIWGNHGRRLPDVGLIRQQSRPDPRPDMTKFDSGLADHGPLSTGDGQSHRNRPEFD